MTYLQRFFEEKEIPSENWEIYDNTGGVHFIGSEFVIELIKKAPRSEKREIENGLRKLDFFNSPILPYLEFLAQQYVNTLSEETLKDIQAA